MNRLDVKGLKENVILFVSIAMIFLMMLAIFSALYIQNYNDDKKEKDYTAQVCSTINYVIEQKFTNYRFDLKKIAQTTDIAQMIKSQDRQKVYNLLKPVWELMQEEEPNLEVMHIHLSNGKLFFKTDTLVQHSDYNSEQRPMIEEINSKHKALNGYETDSHSNTYMLTYPIFDKDKKYIAAIELGLNPNFILEAVEEIKGFSGMIFIEENSLNKYDSSKKLVVDGFALHSELTPRLKSISKSLLELNSLKNGLHISDNGKIYRTHLTTLKDFKNEVKVKIIFFQDISNYDLYRNYFLVALVVSVVFMFLVISWFIYRRIWVYQDGIKKIYDEQKKKIELSEKYLNNVFNATPNIMVTTNGKDIEKVNSTMLDFFDCATLEIFKEKYNCICDLFIDSDSYVSKTMGEQTWLEYILQRQDELHKVMIMKDGVAHLFTLKAHYLEIDSSLRSVVIFNDITELHEISQRLEYAVNGSNDGLWDWDIQGSSIYFSARWKEMLGYRDDELPNKLETWEDLVHPDDLERTIKALLSCHTDEKLDYKIIYRLQHKNGHWIWILDRGYTVFRNNEAIRMVGFHTDITEQKELEEKLRLSKKLFEQFMQNIPANVYIKDKDLKVVYANDNGKEFFSNRDILGKKTDDILLPKDAAKTSNLDRIILEKGYVDEVAKFTNLRGETDTYRIMGFKIADLKNDKIGLIVVNITNEYKAQYEVVKLKSAIDKSLISMMITDIDGNIEYVNQNYTRISGYSYEELMGQNPRIVKSGDLSQEQYKTMWDTISSGKVYASKIRNIAKDGSEFWENLTIVPSFDDTGAVNGYIAFKLEIGDVVELEKELQNKEELLISQSRHAAMGEMISMIAHQWRQPISVIAMDANNILADIALGDLDESSLGVSASDIINQTQELSKTIDDFRNFFKPNKSPILTTVSDILSDALGVIGKSLENHDIRLDLDLVEDSSIKTYSRELMQVVINIIKNAKDVLMNAEQEDKLISITLRDTDDYYILKIYNNGGEIDNKNINKIFEAYFTTKNEKNATGLGLYMSKTIVEKHLHGFLEVQNVDDGVCFELKIPHAMDDTNEQEVNLKIV